MSVNTTSCVFSLDFREKEPHIGAMVNVDTEWMRDRLRALGRPQRVLAEALGRDAAVASAILRGTRQISVSEVPALAEALDTDALDVLAHCGIADAGPARAALAREHAEAPRLDFDELRRFTQAFIAFCQDEELVDRLSDPVNIGDLFETLYRLYLDDHSNENYDLKKYASLARKFSA